MSDPDIKPPSRPIAVFLAAFFLFAICAVLGVLLTRATSDVTLFWPANAALVWLGLVAGRRYLPQILIGSFLANAAVQFAFGDPLLLVFGMPLANTVEIALVLWAFTKFDVGIGSLTEPRKVQYFLRTLALAAIPAVFIGAATIYLAFSAPFPATFIRWWAADVISMVFILLPIASPREFPFSWNVRKWSIPNQLEFVAGVLLSGLSIFLLSALGIPPAVGIILPLLWIALRCGTFFMALTSATLLAAAIGLIAAGYWHAGPVGLPLADEIFQLQVTFLLCSVPALFVAASINSRSLAFTALANKEQQASKNFSEIQMTLANMNQGISCFDGDYNLTIWNRKYADMFGLNPDTLRIGMPFLDLLEFQKSNGDLEAEPRDLMASILAHTNKGKSLFVETELSGGRVIKTVHAPNPNGGWIGTHEDVTEKRNTEKGIAHDALHDELTGLPNRRYHEQELAERAEKCRKTGDGLALLHIDLDRFKQINDTLGHAAGDAMLIHAGKVLRALMRENDFVARIGGDEFVAVCYTKGDFTFLKAIANRIIAKMHEPVPFEDQMCRFGVSIGIAHQQGDKVDGKNLLINADLALYRAKNKGRGCFQMFTEALHAEVVNHKMLSDEILEAIEKSQFVTHYQPQIDAKKNAICGVEALVRWEHPTRGLLGPDAFLPIAEEIDQVARIDQIVLGQTLRDMARWKLMGLDIPHASVNVSARRLGDPGLIEHLKGLDIQPGQISFELIESIYLDEAEDKIMQTVDQIKELGIDIELDDFGTGHTSIISLHAIMPNRLKIDRRLVIPIVDDPQRLKIITSVIDIARALNIEAIAEGVESMQHVEMLVAAGCNLMQGYVYSRPLCAEDLEAYIASKSWKTLADKEKIRLKKRA